MKNKEISFYVDTLIVESLCHDAEQLKKLASEGIMSGLITRVREYVSSHIDPNDKVGSLVNILGPGAISMTFNALGIGWIGTLIGLCMRIFNIDVKAIIAAIWDKLKSLLVGEKQISSTQVDNIVQESVQQNNKNATPEEAEKAIKEMESQASILAEVKILKLALLEYQNVYIDKKAAPSGFLSMYSSRKSKTASILTRVLGWIFKVALASAGLLLAGDIVNKFLGRPNAFDKTIEKGKPIPSATPTTTQSAPIPTVKSTQTKYPGRKDYIPEHYNVGQNWIEQVYNNDRSIELMLINFAKSVYSGLNGKEGLIASTSGFRIVKNKILWYNHTTPEAPFIFIPKYFTSKKQIVDLFIDEVAKKS